MKTNYSPQCAFQQNDDIFNFSDNLNLSDDEYSLSCSSNSANAFKFKHDLNCFISKQDQFNSRDHNNSFNNEESGFVKEAHNKVREDDQNNDSNEQCENSYLKSLKEQLELEEEFAQIFGLRRQTTNYSDITSSERVTANQIQINSTKENMSHDLNKNRSSECMNNSSSDFLKLMNTAIEDHNSFNQYSSGGFRFMISSQSPQSSNIRQPKPIRGSTLNTGRKFSPIEKSFSIQRPSNPMMLDIAFTRVNSDNGLIDNTREYKQENLLETNQQQSIVSLQLVTSQNIIQY